MIEFYPVCKFSEIGFDEAKSVTIENHAIAIFNVKGKLYAIDDLCPHMKVPLATGVLNGKNVICGAHFWEIDVTTGLSLKPQGHCVNTYPVKIERGIVKVGYQVTDLAES
jgi:nitrite reductase/ring-hydroxylating ferredoxin subunit